MTALNLSTWKGQTAMTRTTTETEPRKPIRMGEIALAMATRPHAEPTSDVEINRSTTNGRWGFKVKVTASDPSEAYAKAIELAASLDLRFPNTNGAEPAVKPPARRQRAQPLLVSGTGVSDGS